MSHFTEDELRTVLTERSGGGPGRPPRLEEITERGRGVRLRRRVTAGAALAGAALGVFGVVLPGLGREPVVSSPATSVRVRTGVEVPATVEGSLGKLSLIHAETHEFVGRRVEVSFRPTSVFTGWRIRCADPKDWVLVRYGPDFLAADFSRCGAREGSGLDSQHDGQSASQGWLAGPQSMEIWVFPADAPISQAPPGEPYANCEVADRKQGTCDGEFTEQTLFSKPERLAAVVGPQPGLWSVGIYDKAEAS